MVFFPAANELNFKVSEKENMLSLFCKCAFVALFIYRINILIIFK